jgi:LAS superfamily LD-carboxypeptidase LdcB
MRIPITILLFISSLGSTAQITDSLQYVLGKFEPTSHPDFAKVPISLADKEGMFLRKDALDSFRSMAQSAAADGIQLRIISATRNFNHQKRIWESKWNGDRLVNGKNLKQTMPDPAFRAKEILRYSSMPGTSRHHWGTDIDINSLSSSYFKSGKGRKEYEWLVKNAGKFGFCQVYSTKNTDRPNGYEEEEWHWSYLPSAKRFQAYHLMHVTDDELVGFAGARSLGIKEISGYVSGISPTCK